MFDEPVTEQGQGVGSQSRADASEADVQTESLNAVIGVFPTHVQAEQAIKTMEANGFSMRRLSIIGKGYHTEERPVGFYTTGDRVKTWGGVGLFWGSIWGLLFGAAFFWVPGIGPIGSTRTDGSGRYTIGNLPEGTHQPWGSVT